MIVISQEKENRIALRVESTIDNPYFLIVFTNNITCDVTRAVFENLKEVGCDYSVINIIETAGVYDPNIGDVSLSHAGTWTMDVYSQTSPSNLDEDLADNYVGEYVLQVLPSNLCD